MSHLAKVLIGMMAMALVSLPVSADEVGLSGECYNADGSEGGQGRVNVGLSGETDLLTPDEALSIAVALAEFGQNALDTGNQCSHADDADYDSGSGREDYLEVHAAGVQVCYHGSSSHEDIVYTSGYGCSTTPNGPQ